ncbi:MAG: hypothetical protein ACK5TC_02460, partial [bacterium]
HDSTVAWDRSPELSDFGRTIDGDGQLFQPTLIFFGAALLGCSIEWLVESDCKHKRKTFDFSLFRALILFLITDCNDQCRWNHLGYCA